MTVKVIHQIAKIKIDGNGSQGSSLTTKYHTSGEGHGCDRGHSIYFFCGDRDGYGSGHREQDEQFILTHGDGYGHGYAMGYGKNIFYNGDDMGFHPHEYPSEA